MIHSLCVLHITNQCNLKCKHCYASAGSKLENELSLKEIKKLVEDLDDLGTQYIILSGGEPFLHKGFFSILGYCEKKKINTMITSNGTLITDSIAKRLKDYNYLDSVQISIDSHDPLQHNNFRGVDNAFQLALRGIKTCIKNGIKVSVMTTLSKINIDNMETNYDTVKSILTNKQDSMI